MLQILREGLYNYREGRIYTAISLAGGSVTNDYWVWKLRHVIHDITAQFPHHFPKPDKEKSDG